MVDRLLLASAAFGALMCSYAQASNIDLSDHALEPKQFNDIWNGFYLGGMLGISVVDAEYAVSSTNFDTLAGSQNFSEPAPLGGFYAGYNFQLGDLVLGLEGDIAAVGFTQEDYFFNAKTDEYVSESIDVLATLRARAGFGSDNYLAYVTGGVAVGHVDIDYSYADIFGGLPDDNYNGSGDALEFGWTVGGGAEFRLDERWSVRAEYLYVDLADSVLTVGNSLGFGTNTITYDNNLHVGRIGLTFQF